MKIIHCIWSSNIGGIESVVLNLCLVNQTMSLYDQTVFIAQSNGPLISKLEKAKINIIKGEFIKGTINISKLTKLIALFKKHDIIHIHSFNPIIALAAICSRKKIVYTEHGNFGFQRNLSVAEKVMKKIQSAFINNFIDHYTSNSNFTQVISIKRYGLKNVNKSVVYNGIPIQNNAFQPNNKTASLTIGTICRLVLVKKIDRLIKSLSISQNTQIKLEIIGDGPEKDNLLDLTKQLQLENQIEFLGYRDDKELFYSNWDMCIVPSSGEAFGLVVVEAYLYGCPVAIFKDGGGMKEIVNKVDPHLIFDSENELGVYISSKNYTLNLIKDQSKREERNMIAHTFSIENMNKEMFKIYQSL